MFIRQLCAITLRDCPKVNCAEQRSSRQQRSSRLNTLIARRGEGWGTAARSGEPRREGYLNAEDEADRCNQIFRRTKEPEQEQQCFESAICHDAQADSSVSTNLVAERPPRSPFVAEASGRAGDMAMALRPTVNLRRRKAKKTERR